MSSALYASKSRLKDGLYAIIDFDACERRGLDWWTTAQAAMKAKPRVLQLRAKDRPDRIVLDGLRRLRALIPSSSGTWLFANDRPDLAALALADGVHLGQDDLPVEVVRKVYPHLAVGLSTHDARQLGEALRLPLDYVALGPVFSTASKAHPEAEVGAREFVRLAALARRVSMPLVAIGGITPANWDELAGSANLAAVISALLPSAPLADPAAHIARASTQWALRLGQTDQPGSG